MTTLSKIETERNNLIKTLDKLNFVVGYSGTDGKIDKENYMGATFTGYTADLLYGAYANAISFIQENQSKFVSDLDLSYSFNGISMTTEQLSYFLSVLLLEKNKKITDLYTKDPIFTDRIQKNIKKRVDAFILPLTNKNDVKIKKYPTRKNDKTVSFGIVAETPITNTTEIQNLINVKTTKNNKTTIELNYYRAYE